MSKWKEIKFCNKHTANKFAVLDRENEIAKQNKIEEMLLLLYRVGPAATEQTSQTFRVNVIS